MFSLDSKGIGIYEKALPLESSWEEKFGLAEEAGYSFVEMSIDESDRRLSRLDWSQKERLSLVQKVLASGLSIPSLCLSGHRRFPLGSLDSSERNQGLKIMKRAIELAVDLGIRNIQLAGYDVYYSPGNRTTRAFFMDSLKQAVGWAEKAQVMLSMEIMDHPFMNSISSFLECSRQISSPWLALYPDIGNLAAWGNDIEKEVLKGLEKITAFHLKDTKSVTGTYPGQFKNVPFGDGCVDFPHFFSLLRRVEYKGVFLVEMWTEEAEDPLLEIQRARLWLESKMKEGGFYLC